MDTKKKQVLEALERSLGVVTTAVKAAGISRSTFYNWLEKDADFAREVKDIEEQAIDFSESKLFQLIAEKDKTAVIFHLKTKGKSRGYVEGQDIHISQGNQKPSWLDEAT